MKSPDHAGASSSYTHRLNAYSLAAGMALAASGTAQASIIYENVNQTLFGNGILKLDLNRDNITDFEIHYLEGTHRGLGFAEVSFHALPGNDGAQKEPYGLALALDAGDLIGPNRVFKQYLNMAFWVQPLATTTPISGEFANAQGKFLGLRFHFEGNTYYGWARVNVPFGGTGVSFEPTLVDFAYENVADRPIAAGAGVASVPEPATLGLLALGAAGIALWRRKSPEKKHK